MKKMLILAAALSLSVAASSAMAADGAKLAKRKCATCHDLSAKQKKKVGPPLWGITGRASAAAAGFKYSKNMKALGVEWDDANLDKFLKKPSAMVKRTKMKFAGLKKDEERAAVIEYLKGLK